MATCGFPLAPGITYLEEKLQQQVDKAIAARFIDQRLVALDTSDVVLNRITSHVRHFLWLYAGLIAIVTLGLTFAGIRKYNDFSALVQEAETRVRPKIDAAKKDADDAAHTATEAKQTAVQAKTDSDNVSREVKALSGRASGLEEETTRKITQANQHVSKQVADLDAKVETALPDISKQENKLANTDELVTALFFRKGEVESLSYSRRPTGL